MRFTLTRDSQGFCQILDGGRILARMMDEQSYGNRRRYYVEVLWLNGFMAVVRRAEQLAKDSSVNQSVIGRRMERMVATLNKEYASPSLTQEVEA